jgi:hypothetical protein
MIAVVVKRLFAVQCTALGAPTWSSRLRSTVSAQADWIGQPLQVVDQNGYAGGKV